jgi:hypothetical protein
MIEWNDVTGIDGADLGIGQGLRYSPLALRWPHRTPIGGKRTSPVVLRKYRSKQTNNFIL